MNAKHISCQEEVFSILAKAGVPSSAIPKEMRDWIALSCALDMPAQEIGGLLVRTLDWKSILESIKDYGLTDDEVAELKDEFFTGKLSMTRVLDKAKAKSDQKPKPKPAIKTAKTTKGHGKGSSD